MNATIKRLIESRNSIATEMQTLVDSAEAENRGLSEDERTKWDKMCSDIESYDSRIEIAQRAHDTALRDLPEDATLPTAEKSEPSEEEQYNRAFGHFIRGFDLTSEDRQVLRSRFVEHRAQSTTDAAGGYTIPEGFVNNIETAMKSYSGIFGTEGQIGGVTVLRTATGNDLPYPTVDDTGNVGALLAENTQDSEQDITFAATTLGAYFYTSKIIRVSLQLIQDSAFDMDAYIQGRFGERLGRALAAAFATGTGSAQPNGLITASALGKTAASATAITWLELLDLKHSVDPAYRQNARWVMNDSTLKAVKALVDGQSRPLWAPGIAGGAPATLDGDPYVIDQGVGSIATGVKTVAYGDLSKYHIRIVREMTSVRLVERYADYHQVGFIAFMRADGDLVDAGQNPVKHLIQA